MNSILKKILDEAGEIHRQRGELASQLSAIRAERDGVIEAATGPDDRSALDKLNAISAREGIALHRLELTDRQIAGVSPKALNEAAHVKKIAIKELVAKKNSHLARITKALSPHYASPDDCASAVQILASQKTPPALREIGKALAGLEGSAYQPNQVTGLEYASQIATLSDAATTALG